MLAVRTFTVFLCLLGGGWLVHTVRRTSRGSTREALAFITLQLLWQVSHAVPGLKFWLMVIMQAS